MKNDKINSGLIAKALALSMILSLGSCSDTEQEVERRQTNIGFRINVDENGWSGNEAFATRNNEDEEDIRSFSDIGLLRHEADTVLSLTAEGNSTNLPPMFLHVSHSDFLGTVSSEQEMGEQTQYRTRATPVRTITMYHDLGLFAALYPAGTTWSSVSSTTKPAYLYNKKVTKASRWETKKPWPGGAYRLSFFAYAPHNCNGVSFSPIPQVGSPKLTYIVPNNVADQKDLLTTFVADKAGDTNGAFPLDFKHALTAVKFVCGSDMQAGKVVSVSFENVYSKGTYDMGTEIWSSLNTPKTFSQTINKMTSGTPNESLTSLAQTFMMLPQTLPVGAKVKVVFEDETSIQHTLAVNIGSSVWHKGKTVVYKISTTSINWAYVLNVTAPSAFPYTGGIKSYMVESYKKNSGGSKIAVPWTTEYSENGGSWTTTKPDWLTGFTANAPGSTTPKSYPATVAAQIGTSDSPHTAALQTATPKGSSGSPYNLSNQTDGGANIENTANCYVVEAPGYYSLPLVYGNGIKNGAINSSAYTSMASGSNILNPFINHAGNGITSPYLAKNYGVNPYRAELIWQDALNLVTEINYEGSLFSNKGGIKFKVPQTSICQGNALIAIKDASNTVLWSWHIWVTDAKINETIAIKNHQGYTYKMMPVNLGWCDRETTSYAGRSCKVKFTAGNQSRVITITQNSGEETSLGNNTFYSLGRKDPLRPGSGIADNSNKTWYNASGTASTANHATEVFGVGATCIRNNILKPDVMNKGAYEDKKYANLWSANNTTYTTNDNPVVKTVYDPSPVGFKLPPSNAFTGFTLTGVSTNTISEINGSWDGNKIGWHFKTGIGSETIFFPITGIRQPYSGSLAFVARSVEYWVAVPNSSNNGWCLFFHSSGVKPLDKNNRSRGFAVRSSHE